MIFSFLHKFFFPEPFENKLQTVDTFTSKYFMFYEPVTYIYVIYNLFSTLYSHKKRLLRSPIEK